MYLAKKWGAVVRVKTETGTADMYLGPGQLVPGDALNLDHLIEVGLVQQAEGGVTEEPDPTPEEDPDETDPGLDSDPIELEKLTIPELRALAAERGIDLGDVTRRADIIAILNQ